VWEFTACLDGWAAAHGNGRRASGDIGDDRLAELGIEGF